MADTTTGQTLDKLGIEFFSKVSPDFGENVEKAVKDFQDKFKAPLKDIQNALKTVTVQVNTFFNLLKEVPAINLGQMIDPSGLVGKVTSTFKDIRAQSVREVQQMSSGIRGEINSLQREFANLQKWITQLKAGENPIIEWGKPAFSNKGMYFPDAKRAIDQGMLEQAPQEEIRAETERLLTEYAQRQFAVYQRMTQLVGEMGAFETARAATSELIAQRAAEELKAKEQIAEFVKVTKELMGQGLLAAGVDEKKLAQMRQHLETLAKDEEGRKFLEQEIEEITKRIVKDQSALRDIILSASGIRKEDLLTEEKILRAAAEITKQYEAARAAMAAGGAGGGAGGAGGPGNIDEWQRLIGAVRIAGDEVSKFQLQLQKTQMRAYINPNEFERATSLARNVNAEIARLTDQIGMLGKHSEAAKLAAPFEALDQQVKQVAEGIEKKTIANVDQAVHTLADSLKNLAGIGKEFQLQGIQTGLTGVNNQIQSLTRGADINLKTLKQMGLGTLELEKLQGLLAERMALLRQQFQLTGTATAEMNAQMRATGEAFVQVQHYTDSFTRRTGDALRAMDRWGAGFKDMLKSQMAWLVGGALIFGTLFKVQQALLDGVGAILTFKQSIIDVGAITEASAGEMKILEQAARDVATTTKMSFKEVTDALKILGQAGLTARQSADALKTVGMLVTATGASSQEAVKVLTTAMNVWNLSAKEATRVGNVLAAALNYSKLEIGDLSTSFNYVAATAKQVGMSIEQTAASIAVLSNAGLRASTIGTGLRGILGLLIAPTKQFRDELDLVGVRFEDIRMPGHNLVEILSTLTKAGFDLTNIFEGMEKRQAGVFASMRDAGAEAFQRMTERLTGTNAMMVMFERSMEGPENQLAVLKNQALDMALGFSGVVVPSLQITVTIMQKLVIALKDIGVVIAGLGLVSLIKYLTAATDGLAGASTRLGAAWMWLANHPILRAILAITAAYTALRAAYDYVNAASERQGKAMDREISGIIKEQGELERLAMALRSGNISQEEAMTLIAGLTQGHTEMRNALEKSAYDHVKWADIVTDEIKRVDVELNKLKGARLNLDIAQYLNTEKALTDINAQIAKLNETAQVNEQRSGAGKVATYNPLGIQKQLDGMRQSADQLRTKLEGLGQPLVDFVRQFSNLSIDDFVKQMRDLYGFSEQSIVALQKIRAELKANQIVQDEARASAEMRKALMEWERKAASDYVKLEVEKEQAMKQFEGNSEQAIRGRLLVEQWYQKERAKLDQATTDKIESFQDDLAQRRIRREIEAARDQAESKAAIELEYQARILQINKDMGIKLRELRETQARPGKDRTEPIKRPWMPSENSTPKRPKKNGCRQGPQPTKRLQI